MGISRALEDPEGTTRKVLEQVLHSQAGGAGLLDPGAKETTFVNRIGLQLVHAAEAHVSQQLDEVADDEDEKERLEVKLQALHNLPWKFVVINHPVPNAFVTDVLPGYVFVHKGLLTAFEHSEDQLAFILGHELGHYLLDHGRSASQQQAFLSLFQLVVLAAVDPTGGLVEGAISVLTELGVVSNLLHVGATLPSSRMHEREADELGLQLVSRTCRDPKSAAQAHAHLASLDRAAGRDPSKTSYFDTHPATEERLQNLETQVPAAKTLYDACGCASRKQVLLRSLGYNGAHEGRSVKGAH